MSGRGARGRGRPPLGAGRRGGRASSRAASSSASVPAPAALPAADLVPLLTEYLEPEGSEAGSIDAPPPPPTPPVVPSAVVSVPPPAGDDYQRLEAMVQ